MIRHLIIAMLVTASAHAERPADYAFGVPLTLSGHSAFHRVGVPAVVYESSAKRGLADVRVFNVIGEQVPFAWVPRPASVRQRSPAVPLPMFPLYLDRERRDVAGLSLAIVRNAAGTTIDVKPADGQPAAGAELGGYVLDASALGEPLTALVFALPQVGGATSMRLAIEASDDLAAWRSVAPDATLVKLEYDGHRLVRDRIEIAPTKAKYLRVSWPVGQPTMEFTAVSGEYLAPTVEAPRQWRETVGSPVANHEGEYEYDIGGRFPADRIDIVLAEPNSIVPTEILARASPSEPWQPVATSVFYRLRKPGGDVVSDPIEVIGDERRYWLLRFDPRSGGSGLAPPAMRVGWQTQEIVFAARGPGPFLLAYGSVVAKPGGLPIETVVPGYDSVKGLPADVAPAFQREVTQLGGPARLRDAPDGKRWLLWASLVLGAAVLGWMAWRLSKELGAGEVAGPGKEASPRD